MFELFRTISPGKIAIAILLIILAVSTGVSSCQVKHAQNDANFARSEAERLQVMVETLEAENAKMREILARANEAIARANLAVKEAAAGHVERIEKIENVDPDWIMCPLPDELRDMFREGKN